MRQDVVVDDELAAADLGSSGPSDLPVDDVNDQVVLGIGERVGPAETRSPRDRRTLGSVAWHVRPREPLDRRSDDLSVDVTWISRTPLKSTPSRTVEDT